MLPYLELTDPAKRWPRERMIEVLAAGDSFPSFSAAVLKLARLAKDDAVGMAELAELISKEPGQPAGFMSRSSPVGLTTFTHSGSAATMARWWASLSRRACSWARRSVMSRTTPMVP